MKTINGKSVIVLGQGFLGKEFARQGYEVWGRGMFDYPSWNETTYIAHALHKLKKYDIIINCIAKSNTRWCEELSNFEEALHINGDLPKQLSVYCEDNDHQFVHISTGCLYDNYMYPQKETDFLAAHCNYTVTKWIGEKGCNPNRDLILRPRLLFSDIADRNNLLSKLPKFKAYTTTVNSLSCTSDVVRATTALLEANQVGIFNVANRGYRSMAEIGSLIYFNKPNISSKQLREEQHLYLVDNIMDTKKLEAFYTPDLIQDAIIRCWKSLSA